MSLRVTVVGCSGSYPGPDSSASCYLVEAEHDGRTWRVLLDLGSGSLGALHSYADPLSIDAVLLSHLHADHCLDLCGFYVLRKYHPEGPQPRIPVHGPAGTADRMARAYDLPADPGMHEEFDFVDYDGRFKVGPFEVEPVQVDHPVPAYGLRVRVGGATLAYTGDTGPGDGVDAVARGADVLLAEASFRTTLANPPHLHLTGADAGDCATRAGVGRLVITHVPPWHDPEDARAEARTTWSGALDLARPGMVLEL